MIIDITQGLVDKYKKEGLNLEEGIILSLLFQGEYELLNLWDENSKSIRSALIYQKLFTEGWIETDNSSSENLFKLSEKGLKLFEN